MSQGPKPLLQAQSGSPGDPEGAAAIRELTPVTAYRGTVDTSRGRDLRHAERSWEAVAFKGNVLATYEWSLAGYINDNADTLSEKDMNLAVALYNYAVSGSEYISWKIANGLNNNW